MSEHVCGSQRQRYRVRHSLRLASGLLLMSVVLSAPMAYADSLRRLVEFAPGTSVTVQQEVVAASGSRLLKSLPLVNSATIKLPQANAQAALDHLSSRPEVKQIHADPQVSAQVEVDTEGIALQFITPAAPPAAGYPWNLLQITLHQVSPIAKGQGVEIAVVDSGIDPTHPALAGVVIGGYNAVTGAATDAAASGEGGDGEGGDGEGGDGEGGDSTATNYRDCNGHGTHVAGIIAANTVGIAPQAKLHAVRVLDCQGGGFVSDLISGLSWVYERPQIRVVNMSLGFYKTSPYPLLHQAIKTLHDAGVVLVAAAGNYRTDCLVESNGKKQFKINSLGCNTRVKFPARYKETIAVAATDADSKMAYYSIHGPEVDVSAPGGTLLQPVVSTTTRASAGSTADPAASGEGGDGEGGDGEGGDGEGGDSIGAYGSGSGTSIAAAHVTGVVALMLSVRPSLTPADVRAIFKNSATLVSGASASGQGHGRIRAAAAVAAAATWHGSNSSTPSQIIGANTSIGAQAVLGNSVKVGNQVVIGTASTLMDFTTVGDYGAMGTNTALGQYAKIEERASMGNNVAVGHYTMLKKYSRVGAAGADVFGTTIGDYSVIEEHAVVGTNVYIGDNVVIEKQASIGDRTTIGNGTFIDTQVVVGHDVTVGHNVTVNKQARVCAGAVIPDNAEITSHATVGTCL